MNQDFKLIMHWLRANRISLNVDKTEIFRQKRKQMTKHMKFGISKQKIIPEIHTKYLGLILDEHLKCSAHRHILKKRLSTKAKAKIQYFEKSIDHYILCNFYLTFFVGQKK